MLKGSSTLYTCQKKPDVKALLSRRVNIVHPANSKALILSCSPLVLIPMPYHLRGKVLIECVKDFRALYSSSICFKPSHKCGVLLLSVRIRIIRAVDNTWLMRSINLKAHYIWNLLLHIKEKEAP